MKTFLILLTSCLTSYSSFANQHLVGKLFDKHSNELIPICVGPAVKHCGKVTKSMLITKSEFSCLYKLSTRLTKNFIPGYDGSKCDKKIKSIASGKRPDKIASEIYSSQKKSIFKNCVPAATKYCGKVTRSMAVSRDEFYCLYKLSTRLTRNYIPGYDGSKCDLMIKDTKKKISSRNQNAEKKASGSDQQGID